MRAWVVVPVFQIIASLEGVVSRENRQRGKRYSYTNMTADGIRNRFHCLPTSRRRAAAARPASWRAGTASEGPPPWSEFSGGIQVPRPCGRLGR